MINICIFTGTRAEYGLLKKLIIKLKRHDKFNIKVIASGTHLSKMHGYTIENDGINVDYKLEMLLTNDSSSSIVKSIGLEMIGLSDYFVKNKFDYIMVLGDRYEVLAIVYTALIFNIKIIHLCGGDTTLGAYDDNIRHAITQMAHIHFPTCEESAEKIKQLGRENILVVGNPGLEDLLDLKFRKKIINYDKYILFVYHPETKNLKFIDNDLDIIKDTIKYIIDNKYNIVVIGSNADNCNNKINKIYNEFNNYENFKFFTSLDRDDYINLIKDCSLFMGNSSSGIYEVPYFNKYVINIGDRQKGRRKINNVIDVTCDYDEIIYYINNFYDKYGNNNGSYPVLQSSKLIIDYLLNLK